MIRLRSLPIICAVSRQTWFLAGILLLALILRLYRIDAQSLWYDEGTSVALAGRDLATITRDAAGDIHPPLYYYLLHSWVRLAGTSEAGVRSLSAGLGVAVVGLTYLLARRLFGPRLALLAAFLSAISPFQVYYSQEARMYILVTCLGLLSVYFTVSWMSRAELALRNPRFPILAGYLVVTIMALYTHYFAFTLLLAENVAVCGYWLTSRGWRTAAGRRLLAAWVTAQVIVGLAFVPWLLVVWRQIQAWPAVSAPFGWGFLLGEVLRVFPLGLSVPRESTWLTWALGGMLLLGMLPWGWRKVGAQPAAEGGSLFLSICYMLVPILAMGLLSIRRPMYNPKFLLLATPAYHILLARGALAPLELGHRRLPVGLGPALATLLGVLIMLPAGVSLRSYYFDPAYARDDYRGIARYVEAAGQPGDAVVLNAPGQIEIFSYYYNGDLPLYPLPGQRPPDRAQTEAALEAIARGHSRVFAVLWATDESDPEHIVEGWLDDHGYKAVDAWYGNVRLAMWAVPSGAPSRIEHPASVNLGDRVTFLGYSLASDSVVAGDILPLTLYWQARQPIAERYKVFVHLLDAQGRIIGQRDSEPCGGTKLTTSWVPGEVITDNYGVLVPFGTPPGMTRLVVGMYHHLTGERLPVVGTGEDHIVLGEVRIEKPGFTLPIEALGMDRRVDAELGPLHLLGYILRRLGAEHDPRAPIRPGDVLNVVLFWRSERPATDPVQVRLRLLAGDGRVLAEEQSAPVGGSYPVSRWEPDEVVRDQHHVGTPPEASPGRYRLVVAVAEGEAWLGEVVLAQVVIE